MSVFVVVSGIGWLIDLSVFFLLTNQFALNVFYSNILSSIPGFTFVFVVSTNKIFKKDTSNLSLKQRYLIYFIYQIILVLTVSLIGQLLFQVSCSFFESFNITVSNTKFIVKILITPITIVCNFFVMRYLIEKK